MVVAVTFAHFDEQIAASCSDRRTQRVDCRRF